MADISITAGNVVPSATASTVHGTAGATITAGQTVYLDTTTNTYKLCDADVAASAVCAGIALHGASAGQPLTILTDGQITIGATVVRGTAYYVSLNAGGICPVADISTGDYVSLVGIADSTTTILVKRINTGVVI